MKPIKKSESSQSSPEKEDLIELKRPSIVVVNQTSIAKKQDVIVAENLMDNPS